MKTIHFYSKRRLLSYGGMETHDFGHVSCNECGFIRPQDTSFCPWCGSGGTSHGCKRATVQSIVEGYNSSRKRISQTESRKRQHLHNQYDTHCKLQIVQFEYRYTIADSEGHARLSIYRKACIHYLSLETHIKSQIAVTALVAGLVSVLLTCSNISKVTQAHHLTRIKLTSQEDECRNDICSLQNQNFSSLKAKRNLLPKEGGTAMVLFLLREERKSIIRQEHMERRRSEFWIPVSSSISVDVLVSSPCNTGITPMLESFPMAESEGVSDEQFKAIYNFNNCEEVARELLSSQFYSEQEVITRRQLEDEGHQVKQLNSKMISGGDNLIQNLATTELSVTSSWYERNSIVGTHSDGQNTKRHLSKYSKQIKSTEQNESDVSNWNPPSPKLNKFNTNEDDVILVPHPPTQSLCLNSSRIQINKIQQTYELLRKHQFTDAAALSEKLLQAIVDNKSSTLSDVTLFVSSTVSFLAVGRIVHAAEIAWDGIKRLQYSDLESDPYPLQQQLRKLLDTCETVSKADKELRNENHHIAYCLTRTAINKYSDFDVPTPPFLRMLMGEILIVLSPQDAAQEFDLLRHSSRDCISETQLQYLTAKCLLYREFDQLSISSAIDVLTQCFQKSKSSSISDLLEKAKNLLKHRESISKICSGSFWDVKIVKKHVLFCLNLFPDNVYLRSELQLLLATISARTSDYNNAIKYVSFSINSITETDLPSELRNANKYKLAVLYEKRADYYQQSGGITTAITDLRNSLALYGDGCQAVRINKVLSELQKII